MRAIRYFSICLLQLLVHSVGFADVPERLLLKDAPPVELPVSATVMVKMETEANPAQVRSPHPFWMEYFEIPLTALEQDAGLGLDPKIQQSMVFEKHGMPHVRWLLNPEDTQYNGQLEEYLRTQGLDFTVYHGRYVGYLTSSRSCIVQDTQSEVTFSIKSSTNQTGGSWKDKKETARAARAGRMMSDFLQKAIGKNDEGSLRIIKEPLSFTIAGVDQAIIVRQYDHFSDPQQSRLLIPAFSATDSEEGRVLAERNGSKDPASFWKFHLIQPLGNSLAELVTHSGVIYNSPHGQNFMIELDANYRPTGLIYAKDYADANIQTEIMSARGGDAIVQLYGTFTNNVSYDGSVVYASANPLYSGSIKQPVWLADVAPWKEAFIESFTSQFNRTLSSITSRPSDIKFTPTYGWNGSYWTWKTEIKSVPFSALKAFLKDKARGAATVQQLRINPSAPHPTCREIFKVPGSFLKRPAS